MARGKYEQWLKPDKLEQVTNWYANGLIDKEVAANMGVTAKTLYEWRDDFGAFQEWALANGYDEHAEYGKCTIDRIDVNGNYEPSNCRWADLDEQNNNKRTCVYVTIDGVTKTVTEWCKETGVNRKTAFNRIKRGWNPIEAVSKEVSR